jgi:hypothetical protein
MAGGQFCAPSRYHITLEWQKQFGNEYICMYHTTVRLLLGLYIANIYMKAAVCTIYSSCCCCWLGHLLR